jgi:hypothetical protein
MDSFSKVVIAVNFIDQSLETLKAIHRMEFLASSEIHFVHIVPELTYSTELGVTLVLPDNDRKNSIRETIVSKMKSISAQVLPYSHKGKVVYECLFSADQKNDFCQYLDDVQANLVIVAARKKRELFASSFTYYIGMNSSVSTLVLKQSGEAHFKGKMKVLFGVKQIRDLENQRLSKKLSFLRNAEIKMLHISHIAQNDFLTALNVPISPDGDAQLVIEESVKRNIESRKDQLLPMDFNGTFSVDCVFSKHSRKEFSAIAQGMDLVVLFGNDRPHYFGSFFHYQLMHGESTLLLLKNDHK